LVYDICRKDTFEHCTKWLSDFRQSAEGNAKVMLVGNKLDIVEKNAAARKVTTQEGRFFAAQQEIEFMETSAVTDEGVDEAFLNLLQGNFLEG
jgi:GTPase SAR1 family protein